MHVCLGKKTSLGTCVVGVEHPQTLQNNFVNTPSPSLASQTLAKMMAIMMVLVLNMRNFKERSALMAMVNVRHKELERQRTNMKVMVIINLNKHERMTVHTIYKYE
jgi:hypothetical protein